MTGERREVQVEWDGEKYVPIDWQARARSMLDWLSPSLRAAIEAEATAAAEQRLRVEGYVGPGTLAANPDGTATLADPSPASPRQGEPVEGALDELAAKAGEYIEAVVTYLDPSNQFTHSRRHHVDRTGEELAELVAARLSTDPAEPVAPAHVHEWVRVASMAHDSLVECGLCGIPANDQGEPVAPDKEGNG